MSRITVITPVHNCMPYLENTLASVYHQSLDRSQFDMVVVDDGSTDGSAECLQQWADKWPQLRVVTQAASGSAGPPRNVGIEHATGDYLFFLDGDDCLGPEALERLLDVADRNDSDVVLAKLVGVNRKVPTQIFRNDVDVADLTSGIYYSLMPFKLVRRSMVLDHGIRFPEHMRISEDQLFVAGCYLAAKRISILGSYDCYYLVRRHDGSNTSFEGMEYATMLQQAAEAVAFVRQKTDPGVERDHFVARHLKVELLQRVNRRFLQATEQERAEMVALAQSYARDWATPSVLAQLPVYDRLPIVALLHGDLERLGALVAWTAAGAPARRCREGDTWFAMAPYFREPGTPFEDAHYEMYDEPQVVARLDSAHLDGSRARLVGHALLRGVDSRDARVSVVARLRRDGTVREAVMTTRPTPYLTVTEGRGVADHTGAGFAAELSFDRAEAGRWDVFVRIEAGSHRTEQRLRSPAGVEENLDERAVRLAGLRGYLFVQVPKGNRFRSGR